MNDNRRRMATEAIHAGEIHEETGAHIAPIYQTSTFTFEDMGAVKAWVDGETEGFIYSRPGNPTRAALARKLAALEGIGLGDNRDSVTAEIFGSGMAAINVALMALAKAGDHIITQQVLYGSADNLITNVLSSYGITNSRLPGLDADALEREFAVHPNTKVVYLETPANPTMRLIDIARTAEIAHAHGAKVVVDNTFATPVLQRPLEHGADVIVHSTTKYINGHGTVVGGAVVTRDPELMEEGVGPLLRAMGAIPSPFDCWLTNIGLKTLPLRMAQHSANGMAVAKYLESHPVVAHVRYPGLPEDPQHELAKRQMHGFGGMIAFDVGSYDAATRMLEKVELASLGVSLGNVDTLIEHPASLTHRMIPPEERAASRITDGLVRISVGIEDVEDILADLDRALSP
ncbi:MAG: PLP-dependent aspartate aminotransferase family protein [Actinomycetota bacterium]